MNEIEIVYYPINDINPAKYNPREIDDLELAGLVESIEKFGLIDPLIVNIRDGKNILVGGHQRLKVAKIKSYEKVPVVEVDLDSTEEIALNIALNNKHIQGKFQKDLLSDLLNKVKNDNQDLYDKLRMEPLAEEYGIKDIDVGLIEPQCDEDDVPELKEESKVKKGDVFILGNHRLKCGDSTMIDDVESLMAGEKADMVFTDPPYGMKLETNFKDIYSDKEGTPAGVRGQKNYDKVIGDENEFDFITAYAIFEYCKEQFWWGGDYYCQQLPKNSGWLVWDKTGGHDSLMDVGFNANFELCWSKIKHKRDLIRHTYKGCFGMKKEDGNRVHPTQKPVGLAEYFIKKWSAEKENIVDIYGGSGSTLIACEKTNRKCYMMELDEKYCQVIIERYCKYTGKKAYLLNQDGSKTEWNCL